ncbi:LOW QUALITY PROTEIN: U2 small nuclear ribonucleoprotein auxiliary factor 35 kDa subunit-related protein 2-like [Gigantopelta aegis]|uniref:LOW QUALITY PROTEIN: U2 small nuclear ribonucleoprotein auxiliary factor 35 kDa subunit-related protein 2-like n=1 Tax=Gigantopelta aegis TaxID=1735272 RepID=UPI001B88E08B|nr:LOW QUALITY PROTEIN: U2 small nuclear ribonucleoprotein auxiliary factor 35 kDa subunit-related protein 2-like [Gigantopelta aegis]
MVLEIPVIEWRKLRQLQHEAWLERDRINHELFIKQKEKEDQKLKEREEREDKINCPFFIKTGACRYGDGCSRTHPIPDSSTTLIIRGMYSHVVLTQLQLDEHDQDVALEVRAISDMICYKIFKEFYEDVFPEFKKHGEIVQFKVSCNYEPHLRGNVYVQYSTEEECARALQQFNGRYYAGKQLTCHFCPVEKWKTAICGLNDLRRCPKGKHCNFLHVFRNPDGSFNWPEKDYEEESKKKERSRSPQERGRYRRPMRYSRSRSRSVERRRRNRRSHSGSVLQREDERGYRYRSPRPRKRSRSPERRRMRRSRSPERRGHHHRRRESRSDSSDSSSEDDSDRRSLSNGHLSDDDDSHDDKRSRKRKGSKETFRCRNSSPQT